MRGFTLVELAIVVVIAGILAAVAIPIYNGLVADAKWSEAKTTLGSVKTVWDTYKARYGNYDAAGNVGAPAIGDTLAGTGLGVKIGFDVTSISGSEHFPPASFAVTALTATSFQLTATAIPAGDPPGVMLLDNTGTFTEP